MPVRSAIVAALPREIAGLVRGVVADPALLRSGIHLYRLESATAVAAGMGSERVAFAVEAAIASGPVEMLVSVGLAGACAVGVNAGSVLEADIVVDAATGERFQTTSALQPCGMDVTLATSGSIASVSEKARLAATYGAAMVDMEAATIARLAQAHGIEFRAIKAISDEHDFELASLARFTGPRGSFRTGAFAAYTALRPWSWGPAMKLGRDSARALKALEEMVRPMLGNGRG